MQLSGLNFNTLPKLALPFRFFVTAPILLLLTLFIVWQQLDTLILNRWHPVILTLVHGVTLGFITTVMIGALIQILPVITGVGLHRPRLIAVLHGFHILATSALLLSFLHPHPTLSIIIIIGFACVLVTLTMVLKPFLLLQQNNTSLRTIKLGLSALLVVVLLGIFLHLGYWGKGLTTGGQSTNIHAIFGLYAWITLVIIGVSFQVIPMFFVTPSYHQNSQRYLGLSLFAAVLAFALSSWQPELKLPSLMVIISCVLFYAIQTLRLLNKRKRKLFDASVALWQLALMILILSQFGLITQLLPLPSFWAEISLNLFAGLFLLGFVGSVILAMLLKILPFLAYMHIQQLIMKNMLLLEKLPTMHELLPKRFAKALMGLQLLNVLTAALTFSTLIPIQALIISLALTCLLLVVAVIVVWRAYLKWHVVLLLKKP